MFCAECSIFTHNAETPVDRATERRDDDEVSVESRSVREVKLKRGIRCKGIPSFGGTGIDDLAVYMLRENKTKSCRESTL